MTVRIQDFEAFRQSGFQVSLGLGLVLFGLGLGHEDTGRVNITGDRVNCKNF